MGNFWKVRKPPFKNSLPAGRLRKPSRIYSREPWKSIDSFILPALGHLKLSEIKPHTVNAFFVSLTKDGCRHDGKPGGYSKGTINKVSNVLSSILRTAVEWEAIERNPCDAVRVKAEDSADKVKFFTPQQAATFLDYISKPYTIHTKGHTRTDDTGKQYTVGDYTSTKELPLQLKTLFTLAIYTGLRKGEILALTWDDVDFENNTVAVTKAAAVVGGKQIVKIPKTRNSYRLVSIPRSITKQLQQLKQEQTRYRLKVGAYWQGDNWIFTQDNGTMMSYYTPYSALQDILNHYNADKNEANKLPMIPFHGLRHTKATLQIAAGTDVRTVSAILGHRETSTTMNIYSPAYRQRSRKRRTEWSVCLPNKREKLPKSNLTENPASAPEFSRTFCIRKPPLYY